MGLLAFFFRALLLLMIFRQAGIVLRAFFGGFFQGVRPGSPVSRRDGFGPRGAPASGGQIEELVKDPICGVHTARSSAIVGRYQGREAYFCSKECAVKADAGAA